MTGRRERQRNMQRSRGAQTAATSSAATRAACGVSLSSCSLLTPPPPSPHFPCGSRPDQQPTDKFWTGYDWQPEATVEFIPAKAGQASIIDAPNAVSWGPDRLDVFYRSDSGGCFHRYWDGDSWEPSGDADPDGLGEDLSAQLYLSDAPVASTIGPGHIDLVAWGNDSQYYHRWLDGGKWNPDGEWESMGQEIFEDPPATVRVGTQLYIC